MVAEFLDLLDLFACQLGKDIPGSPPVLPAVTPDMRLQANSAFSKPVQQLHPGCRPKLGIIGCGGIFDSEDAWSKLSAGASLVQLYTGFTYHGPALVHRIVEDLAGRAAESGTGELTAILAAVHARTATPGPC